MWGGFTVSMETGPSPRQPGGSQSQSVPGRNPDVGAALLLNDGFDQVVDLLEAVAVHDGCAHTHTHRCQVSGDHCSSYECEIPAERFYL